MRSHKNGMVDTLYIYLEKSSNNASDFYRGHYAELFCNILFGGREVSLSTFLYVRSLVLAAKQRSHVGDEVNARSLLYHATKNMGLCD